MEAIYEVSSSEKVRSLEEDLRKELKELQNEVEEGNFMSSSVAPKTSGSVPLPKDADHFRRERKLAIEKSLQVREAQPLIIQSDVMYEEMSSSSQGEYSGKSIPLLLHQFFVERIEHLVQCKHMHMLRWARFCEHTKAIENLFPLYQKRLSYIMEEYHDCIQRARRLAVAFEATLAGSDSAMSVVTMEDLLIYTRWLICMLHSVKRINAFVRQIEWLPSTHKSSIQPQITDKEEKLPEQERQISVGPPSKARGQLKKILSQVSITAHLHVLRPTTVPDADLPPPPPLSLSPYQLVSEINPSFAAAVAASGGGLASDEINLKLPLHETSLVAIKSMLEFLMTCYAVEMDINQINTHADEMDLFTMVSRRFKKVFSKQEQMRTFPIYDASIEEFGDSKIRSEGALHTFKQHSNWISFNPFRPEQTVTQVKAMTKLKQTANIDELLKAHSRFIHVQDGQRVLSSLKEHAKAILEPPKPKSASVTTYRTQNDTAGVWKRIFSYASVSLSSKDDVLEFDTKISEDDMGGSSNTTGEFDLGTAVELLGLDDEDAKTQASKLQGAYMSFLLLRHLRLRDLQRSCLGILNYFQSTERTLVINDCGLSLEGGKLKTSTHQVFHGGGISGIGSHQYVHNTPADYRVEQSEFMEFSEVENHDDFFTMEEGRVHIQDQRGYYILYDSALADFKQLETELLLVATHYIEKDVDFRLPRISGFQGDRIDLGAYGHQKVDRFAVLLDLWTNEAAYLENKRQLVDCYLEAYHHVFDPKEKRRLAQVIVNVIHSRPRFDFSADYFVKIYRAECVCLRLHANLIKSILDAQVDDEREFVQKVSREDNSALFGLPHRIIPQQHIAVNTSRPALNYIYMLEFHPSLGLASRVYEALQNALKVFIQLHKPKCTGEVISLEHRLFEAVQKEWDNQEPTGHSFAQQTQKDLFSEVFVEDPIFVCEVAQSLVNQAAESKKGGRKSVKEKQKILTDVWSNLLEVVTLRHRLITAAQETDVVTKAYKRRAKEIGFDEYHAFLRAVSFDFAQAKPEAEMQSVLITLVTEDDSRVDRYTPAYTPLAIQELDEKHLGAFSFRNREGFRQMVSGAGVQKLQTILMAQIVHKNLIISSVLQLDGCSKVLSDAKANAVEKEKRAGLSPRSSHDTSFASRASSAEGTSSHLTAFSNKRLDREFERKLQEVFVSIQLEKTFLRDKMLNDYIHKKEQMGTVMKNIDEVIKLKRKLVTDFCENLHKRVSQYSLQSQIIAYFASLVNLMADFPTTRDSHFVIGEEDEKKNEEDDKITSDPKQFTPRPRRLLSADGRSLLNLWFIPHYTEILKMYPHLKGDDRNSALRVTLQLISSLHDICQYLCAHARLGSSHARLGSQKLEFSGVTADWGGTEGIGAELREIQRQINHLENPVDPHEVADFLTKRRDNMFLEFDISISHSVRDTFLSTGNEAAYKSITQNMQFALKNLSNLPRPCIYGAFLSVPEPLEASDEVTKSLFPWRSFLDRYGPFPMMYWPWDRIGENMQLCLAGLRDVDRHVVNGEILGVSLLLEDVLQNGLTDIFTQQPDEPVIVGSRSRPGTSMSRRPSSRHGEKSDSIEDDEFETAVPVETRPFADIPKGPVSLSINPQVAVKLINLFLLVCSRLELLKTDWGCRKLGVNEISTSRLYRTFCKIYKIEILQPVYQQVAVKLGLGQEYAALGALVSDDERLSSPPGSTEMELKVKQVIRLLENLECTMIYDVIKRISREHTLVVSERGRDDATLPTDLWKKPAMKENCTISKPHLVENFLQYLMSEHTEKDDRLTFTKEHLDNCLVKLASETMLRERNCFESYAMYYENLLRHQHQLLYIKEQEIKQHLDTIEANSSATIVDVHCQLADRSHEQLLEITALRAKIAEMRESLMNQEKDLRERIKTDFASLVQELFSNCFSMKNRFEEFRLLLHDDVHEGLDDVRRKAVEDMKKLREKSGTLKEEREAASRQVLAKAEQIRGLQEENKHLGQLFLKIKTMNNWKRTRLFIRYHDSVESLREEADKAKRECLEVKKIAEEKEILFKQEQAALRKALSEVERECQKLRKKLQCEQKTKLQKMHAQMQEANSMRQLELAKSTNIDKLISDLEEKELQLRLLTQNLDRDQRRNLFAQEQSKKALKHMMLQLDHERHLKLDAFERVEDLQRQIYEYEQNLISGLSRPGSGAGSRPASRTDKRPLSSYKTAPEAYAASPAFIPSLGTRPTKPINVVNPVGGGIWPPTVLFPQRQATTPDPGVSLAYSPPPKIQRPKTHGGRLRGKISESLLGDLETDDVPDERLPPTAYGN